MKNHKLSIRLTDSEHQRLIALQQELELPYKSDLIKIILEKIEDRLIRLQD